MVVIGSLLSIISACPASAIGEFGITLRGDNPVYIRTVDFDSFARAVGLRSGDLLLAVNGYDVYNSSEREVLELLKHSEDVLELTVVTGGLDTPLFTPATPSHRTAIKMAKAKHFHEKVCINICTCPQVKGH